MSTTEPVNILLVDDQPAKLLSYETVLRELGETLLTAVNDYLPRLTAHLQAATGWVKHRSGSPGA